MIQRDGSGACMIICYVLLTQEREKGFLRVPTFAESVTLQRYKKKRGGVVLHPSAIVTIGS